MTKRETALVALLAALRGALEAAGCALERNADRPDEIGAGGTAILFDGEQTEAEAMFSPLQYEITHTAELFLAAAGEDGRDALLELACAAVGADRTLGGAVMHAECGAPATDLAEFDGAEAGRTLTLPVALRYLAPSLAG